MNKIKVFIGRNKERLYRLLKELEDTTRVLWRHGGKPTTNLSPKKWVYYYNVWENLASSNENLGVGTEVTPEEFIRIIREDLPKPRAIQGHCYYGVVEDQRGVFEGCFIGDSQGNLWSGKLNIYFPSEIKELKDITPKDYKEV